MSPHELPDANLISENNGSLRKKYSNKFLLLLTAILFGIFVIAQTVGAVLSNSLALLGDSAAMSVDVIAYFGNWYGEDMKDQGLELSKKDRKFLKIYLPLLSVSLLFGVNVYITVDAIMTLIDHPEEEDVDSRFLIIFGVLNLAVDIVSSYYFYLRKDDVFRETVIPNDHIEADINGSSDEFIEYNFNMLTAFSHLGGDTCRTVATLAAGIVSMTTTINGDVCDAIAGLIAATTIYSIIFKLLQEMNKNWTEEKENARDVARDVK